MHWWEMLDNAMYADWLASRPLIVKRLLTEFPLGTEVAVAGASWFVFGATEGGSLIVAPMGTKDHREAMAKRQYICADHLRRGEVHFEPQR